MSPYATDGEDLTVEFAEFHPPGRRSASGPVVPFQAASWAQDLPKLTAYIDETGDRGNSDKSSPVFGFAAVIVTPAGESAARKVLRELRSEFNTPASRPLSWKEDIKTSHPRAVLAARLLSAVPGLRVVYVAAHKASLSAGTYRDDVTVFYNYMAYSTLQRIIWTADRWPDGRSQVAVRFSHVAKHDHRDTHRYFQLKSQQDGYRVAFGLLSELKWVSSAQYEMSQVADLYAGFLKSALWPGIYGDVEGAYLLRIWPQIRNSETCVLSLGLMVRPNSGIAKNMEWWPCAHCSSTY